MERVIYSKFNSYRNPKFRIQTCIVGNFDLDKNITERYAEKRALCKEAINHIQSIKDNYNKIKNLYKNIEVLPFTDVHNGEAIDLSRVRFPYAEGKKLNKDFAFFRDMFDYSEDYKTEFRITDQFQKVFTDCFPKEGIEAVIYGNVDSIIDNFLKIDGKIIVFDYEWVFDFPVPVDYIKYRAALSWEEFGEEIIKEIDNVPLYEKMESQLQKYVNVKPYNFNYLKEVKTLDTLRHQYEESVACNNNYRAQVQELETRIGNLEADYNKILDSNSWKCTALFRKIKNIGK